MTAIETAPLTDADVQQLFDAVVPDWLIERLDTKLGTAGVVPILKNQSQAWGIATAVPGLPYSNGDNADWWAFRATRYPKGFVVDVVHEYRDDERPTEVERAGNVGWNRLANMATIAALELRRRRLDELQARSDELQASQAAALRDFDRTPDGDEAKPGIVNRLDGLHEELAEVERQLEAAADSFIETERNVQAMSTTSTESTTTERAPRGPLTLEKPVKNTLEGSTLVQAKRSPQVHVLPADTTTTLCRINTAKWAETTVIEDGKITCPLCATAMKAAVKEAKETAAAGADGDADAS